MAFIVNAKSSEGIDYSFRIGNGDEQFVRDWFVLHHIGSTLVSLVVEKEGPAVGSSFDQVKAAVDADKEIDKASLKQRIADDLKAVLPAGAEIKYG